MSGYGPAIDGSDRLASLFRGHKMPKTEEIGNLIYECLTRCRADGYTLTTLLNFIDELQENGQPVEDVQQVGSIMRQILKDIPAADEFDSGEDSDKHPLADDRD